MKKTNKLLHSFFFLHILGNTTHSRLRFGQIMRPDVGVRPMAPFGPCWPSLAPGIGCPTVGPRWPHPLAPPVVPKDAV